ERFARHWLDLVRYADTSGYERDQEKPFAWRYRDWVVDAMNADKPYDVFTREQLAGDQLEATKEEAVIGTGFLRLGTWNDEPNDPEEYQYERLEDLVHVTSTAFLALTVKCARCHDHKYDPIPQADYYQMAAAFWPGPIAARGRELLGGPDAKELGYEQVLGWTDTRPEVEPLHILVKGDPHRRGVSVQFAALSAVDLPPNNVAGQAARKQLADWIVDERNPLTARVIVNRIWQFYFGTGLVRSVNNFGFRGDQPTHPELLDYLAAELIANDWQLKSIHRLILSSATWGQSCEHPDQADYLQRDASNQLYWHTNRRRLDAEGLRDAILQASGELDLRMGGPGFRPELSAEAVEGLSRKGDAWQPSTKADQRRRSLYLFSQRSLLFPWMTTFDFVETTSPCGQRDVTTVAPQALALLNSPLIHEQCARLAAQFSASEAPNSQAVQQVYRTVLRRDPNPNELTAASEYLARQAAHFAQAGAEEAESAASARTSHDTCKSLALKTLCQVLMNSNEFLYID
ncbi:MAG: DUF1553 domain-containing protein, partial [Planctomycetales bacterium]|nr:DUF1553 domain-containing protein [Planctomycetales bacterium]